jgi:hypothetical protein
MNLFGYPVPGLGAAGPSSGTISAAGGVVNVQVGQGFDEFPQSLLNHRPGPLSCHSPRHM